MKAFRCLAGILCLSLPAVAAQAGASLQPSIDAIAIAGSGRPASAVARKSGGEGALRAYGAADGFATSRRVPGSAKGMPAEAAESTMSYSFVIPSDTCQQGPPLHEFKR